MVEIWGLSKATHFEEFFQQERHSLSFKLWDQLLLKYMNSTGLINATQAWYSWLVAFFLSDFNSVLYSSYIKSDELQQLKRWSGFKCLQESLMIKIGLDKNISYNHQATGKGEEVPFISNSNC